MKTHSLFSRLAVIVVLMSGVFVAYWPAQHNEFVWDDTALVLRDPLIRSWRLIGESFCHHLFLDATASDFYRPLQRVSYIADYAAWGTHYAGGYHWTNVLLHLAAAIALYALLRRLGGLARGWAAGAALVWAVHPIHTSAVTYIAGRADSLAALFGFGALALGAASLQKTGRAAAWRAALAAVGFLGALLSKESGVFAVVAWLIVLAWRRAGRADWLRWAALIAVVFAIYLPLRLNSSRTPPPPSSVQTELAQRPVLAARALAEYAGLLALPLNLHMERDVRVQTRSTDALTQKNVSFRRLQMWLGLGIGALLASGFFFLRKTTPDAALLLLLAGAAYAPISNLFSLNATVAEHWIYVPSALLAGVAALALREWRLLQMRGPLAVFTAGVALWTAWLGSLTRRQQGYWLDQKTFIESTLARGGEPVRMWVNLGAMAMAKKDPATARGWFERALARRPDQRFALLNLADAALQMGDLATATKVLADLETDAFLTADVKLRRAKIAARQGGDPLPLLAAAAAAAPLNWTHRALWLRTLHESNRTDEAVRELRTFLEREPFRAASWRMLGEFLDRLRLYPQAIAAFEQAMRLDVHDAESAKWIENIRRIRGEAAAK